MSDNALRQPDPINPFPPNKIVDNPDTSTRNPNRTLAKPSIPQTQLVRSDFARVYRNAALSVATGNTISWDSVTKDTTGIFNGSTTFTIPATGKITGPWKAKAQIPWSGAGGGTVRTIEIRKNGSVVTTKSALATVTYLDIEDDFFDLSRLDLFTITVAHDAGGSIALTPGSDKMFFSMVHIG